MKKRCSPPAPSSWPNVFATRSLWPNRLSFQACAAMTVGDFPAARRAIYSVRELAATFSLPTLQALAAQMRFASHMATGDLTALERESEALLSLSGQVASALATYGGCLFELRWAQGRLGEFAHMFSDAAAELRGYSGLPGPR